MRLAKVAGVVAVVGSALAVLILTGFTTKQSAFTGTVYIGMDTPLTGPQQPVGQGDREAVEALVRYWNARGGIKGRRIVVDVLDNASNPSQGVQNVRKFLDDSKYAAILGSGNAAAAVATAPIASQGRIPFVALSPPTNIIAPPQPYVYVTLPTSRLYAYSEAQYLKSLGIKRVALMGDNGGYGRDGPAQVEKLAKAYGLTITDTVIFAPTTTSFAAELTKIKSSDAQALWLWTATPAGNTIVKEFKQLQLPQRLILTGANLSPSFLQGTCPDANGAIVNGYLGLVWQKLPKSNPVRAQAELVRKLVKHEVSVFNIDAATALYTLKAAMERSGFTREAINNGLQTKIKGLVTPGGRVYLSQTNHTGIQLPSMWSGRIASCKATPLFGTAFRKK
jgi:branched-chain amino acid transport system substrate-binding protein